MDFPLRIDWLNMEKRLGLAFLCLCGSIFLLITLYRYLVIKWVKRVEKGIRYSNSNGNWKVQIWVFFYDAEFRIPKAVRKVITKIDTQANEGHSGQRKVVILTIRMNDISQIGKVKELLNPVGEIGTVIFSAPYDSRTLTENT